MSTVRWRLVHTLRERGHSVSPTYGYVTKRKRVELGVPTSHMNDAFVIAGGTHQTRCSVDYLMRQVRQCNRKLFKGERSHIRNTAPRVIHGFQRFDKVLWKGIECFVFGRRTSGYFDVRKADGTNVHSSVSYKHLALLESATTFLIERRTECSSPEPLGRGLRA